MCTIGPITYLWSPVILLIIILVYFFLILRRIGKNKAIKDGGSLLS